MDNRVVIIHSTQEGDIGRRVIDELEGMGTMRLGRLFEWQKESRHPIFSLLRREDKLTRIYMEQGHFVYPIEGENVISSRIQ